MAAVLLPLGPWRGIVGISRGGLIPAAIVARELDLRLVETVGIATYDEEARNAPTLLKPPTAAGDGAGFIVIDDLVDTGATARLVRQLLPRAHYACLYAKPEGRPLADTWITEIPQATWLLFPWDTAPAFTPPIGRSPPKPLP